MPVGTAGGQRAAALGYPPQNARAAEQLAFEGALTPTGVSGTRRAGRWCRRPTALSVGCDTLYA